MLESDPGGNQELETGLPVPFNRRLVVLGQSLPHGPVTHEARECRGPTRQFPGKSSCGAEGAGHSLGCVTCNPWERGQTASLLAPPPVPTGLVLRRKEVGKNMDIPKESDHSEHPSSAFC